MLLYFKLDCAAELFDLVKTLINEEDESSNEETPLSDWYVGQAMEYFLKLLIDVGGHSSLWAVPPLYRCPELYNNQVYQAMGSKSVSSITLCWFLPPGFYLDFLP